MSDDLESKTVTYEQLQPRASPGHPVQVIWGRLSDTNEHPYIRAIRS